MTEQPLDFALTVKGLWRRRLLVAIVAFIGLGAGLLYAVVRPAVPRAVALVFLSGAPSGAGQSTTPMATEVVVAASQPVLERAGRDVTPNVSWTELQQEVAAKALSEQVLQIQVSAPRARDAVARANAVANEYTYYVDHVLPVGTGLGPAQVIQSPTSAVKASTLRIPMLGGVGMGLGLLIGLAVALVRSNRDRRLRSRDDIARAIGVPVLASLEAEACRSVSDWRNLLDDYSPSPVVSWNLRQVLHRLAPVGAEHTQEIRVVAFRDDGAALAAGAQLATMAAALGMSSVLAPGDDEVLVPLRAACAIHHHGAERRSVPHPVGWESWNAAPPVPVHVGLASGEELGSRTVEPELTLSLVAVDRSKPQIRPFGGANLLSVSVGSATADDLARVALAAAEAAQALDGILVVNPDPSDATTGSIRDGEVQQKVVPGISRPSDSEQAVGWPG